jgi:hypothetical protein
MPAPHAGTPRHPDPAQKGDHHEAHDFCTAKSWLPVVRGSGVLPWVYIDAAAAATAAALHRGQPGAACNIAGDEPASLATMMPAIAQATGHPGHGPSPAGSWPQRRSPGRPSPAGCGSPAPGPKPSSAGRPRPPPTAKASASSPATTPRQPHEPGSSQQGSRGHESEADERDLATTVEKVAGYARRDPVPDPARPWAGRGGWVPAAAG